MSDYIEINDDNNKRPGRKRLFRLAAVAVGLSVAMALASFILVRIGFNEPGISNAASDPWAVFGKAEADRSAISPDGNKSEGINTLSKLSHPTPVQDASGKLVQVVDGKKVYYTLDASLQKCAESVFAQYKVPYGAVVAIEPATGRILAMADYSAREPNLKGLCLKATYPAASMIKVITSAAALKTGKVRPDTQVHYDGSPYKLSASKVSPQSEKRARLTSTITEALGKSNNVVFAKLGMNVVGAAGLDAELRDFGFNKKIPFEFPLQMSTATVPTETYPLGRTAAGFGEVYISPLHAALIAAAVSNQGVMMSPYIIDKIEDEKGAVVFERSPEKLTQIVEPELARTLAEMMKETVAKGTSSKIFSRYAKKLVQNVEIAGKTGSLSGDDPPGRYEWFMGFAPVGNPKIAVAALIVNRGDFWKIKGTYTAAALMREHFGL